MKTNFSSKQLFFFKRKSGYPEALLRMTIYLIGLSLVWGGDKHKKLIKCHKLFLLHWVQAENNNFVL